MREQDWLSAHIFYHDNLDQLLADLVGPLVDELSHAGWIERYFFIRYWDGGNHLRLRLLPPDGCRDAVHGWVARRVTTYLRRRPATVTVPPHRYATTAARLAAHERVTEYARTPYPNNSVGFFPYRREHGKFGYGTAIEAAERHFADSSQIALAVVAAGAAAGRPADRHRAVVALSLILAAWFCCQPDLDRLLRMLPPAGTADGHEQLRRFGVRLYERVVRGAGEPADGTLAIWTGSVRRLRDAFPDSASQWRVVDTCAHLACNRLGVRLATEDQLRRLAIRTVAALVNGG
jgi:thiopeptide-type bacteriocin biosynthesis protein